MTHPADSPAAPETGFSAEISCSPADCTSAGPSDLAQAEHETATIGQLIDDTLAQCVAALTPHARAQWVHQLASPLGRNRHTRLYRQLRREGSADVQARGRSRLIRLSAILPHLPQKDNK